MRSLKNILGGMKSVTSAGKQVRFRIPKDWQVEENGNGRMYFAQEPNSGTLRLNVLTFEATETSAADPPSIQTQAEEYQTTVKALPNGTFFVSGQSNCTEEEDDLTVSEWLIERRHGTQIVIAIFTFTLLESQMKDAKYREQIAMIDHEVRQAQIQF